MAKKGLKPLDWRFKMDVDMAPETVEVMENMLLTALRRDAKITDDRVWEQLQNFLVALHNANTVHINKRGSF